jgi:hypothetical protein
VFCVEQDGATGHATDHQNQNSSLKNSITENNNLCINYDPCNKVVRLYHFAI